MPLLRTASAAGAAILTVVGTLLPAACNTRYDAGAPCYYAVEHPHSYTTPHDYHLHSLSAVGRPVLAVGVAAVVAAAKLQAHCSTEVPPLAPALACGMWAVGVTLAGLTIPSHTTVNTEDQVAHQVVAPQVPYIASVIGAAALTLLATCHRWMPTART